MLDSQRNTVAEHRLLPLIALLLGGIAGTDACVTVAAASDVSSPDLGGPISESGCIGQSKETCRASLHRFFDKGAIADVIPKPDINGNVNDSTIIWMTKKNAGEDFNSPQIAFAMRLGTGNKIAFVQAILPNSPLYAKTSDDFDKTFVYEAILGVAKGKCKLERNAFYKTIFNEVRPTVKTASADVALDAGKRRDIAHRSAMFKSCGLTYLVGSDHSEAVYFSGRSMGREDSEYISMY